MLVSKSNSHSGRRLNPARLSIACICEKLSGYSNSAGCVRCISASKVSISSNSLSAKRPLVISSVAKPKRFLCEKTAASKLSCLSGNSASSEMVPGVTIRTTFLSTGPLLVAGSPICSQIATDSPNLMIFAK